MKRTDPDVLAWPESRLADAMSALVRRAGMHPDHPVGLDGAGSARIETLAAYLGCEAEPIETTFGELAAQLSVATPAVVRLPNGTWLALLTSTRRTSRVLTPDLSVQPVRIATLCDTLRRECESGGAAREEIEKLLQEAGVSQGRRSKAVEAILRDQFSARRFTNGWSLRVPAGAPAFRWLGQVDALRNIAALGIAQGAQYFLWVASFWIIGQSALSGHADRGWLLAWALVLMTLIPFRLAATWLQGLIAIGMGGLLKQRLLWGALRLIPDEMRQFGIGHFLGQALEAETVETLAINGGIAGGLACLELLVAGAILGRYSILLLAWLVLTLTMGWRFMKRYQAWTEARMGMTQDLVESMVGHRTRLAQQRREQWHEEEDRKLDHYLAVSKKLDRSGALLAAGTPRGWLLCALAALGPGFVSSSLASVDIAIALGGTLLAYQAFGRLTASLSDISLAWVAWLQVAPLYRAAARPLLPGGLRAEGTAKGASIEADAITYRYRNRGEPVLRNCSLHIAPGDRVLLEGGSGGGKSTLAAILAGLRVPESGVLLCGGLDLGTLGFDRWRKRVAAAPQFHENHVLTETLAFNLLMGRKWPPTPSDMEQAANLCKSLGLAELLQRMPGGLLQMVGEGGWQLSHGERSRIFMARALLQGAGLVILDESFAALDPESLRLALQCALDQAETLLVIAHP